MNPTALPPGSAAATACCPRCGGAFICGAHAGQCDCFELKLGDALRAELAQRYSRCLCLGCLRELKAGSANAGAPGSAPG